VVTVSSYVREPTYEVSFLFRRILAPTDGSASSLKALDIAIDFAKRYGSRVTAFIVDDGSIDVEDIKNKISAKAQRTGIDIKIKVEKINKDYESTPTKIIWEAIEGDYDLIIIAARGRTASEDIIIGSTALSTIVNTPISVLVIR
jgi:nucleotide-binding universal stress UspA family protein